MGRVRLRRGHVRPLWAGHPWVYAQAVERVEGAPGPGDLVSVVDPEGKVLGRGFYSPKSAIPVRLMSRDPDEAFGEDAAGAIARRLDAARALRERHLGLPDEATNAYRLVNAEGDELPGLVVDVLGDVAVVQLGTAGMMRREELVAGHVQRVTGATTVLGAPVDVARSEGFSSEARVLRGLAPKDLAFRELGLELRLPASLGQKTGYYLDQRPNRARLRRWAEGARVLDAYAYVGSMGLNACAGGAAEVVALESSAMAVAAGAAQAAHAGFEGRMSFRKEDVKRALPALLQAKERFDVVVLDPPKLAPTKRSLPRAERAYKKLNTLGLGLVRSGGLLVTCSCSGALRPDALTRIVAQAAVEARKKVRLLELHGAGADHPTPPAFPEGRYLKVAFIEVEDR
ncbi:MAG: class I SAM-dependent rRNA methyltransferase [Myxococcota bacterium]